MGMGRKKFNMDPKKVRTPPHPTPPLPPIAVGGSVMDFGVGGSQGIQFLVDNELLRHTAEDIARFLYKGEGLNKTAIGDYLGERWAGLRAGGGA